MDNNDIQTSGNYEVIKNRLKQEALLLKERMEQLNQKRKDQFGKAETEVVGSERVSTAYNCTPRDLTLIGDTLLLGYNIQLGLKQEMEIADVFQLFSFQAATGHIKPISQDAINADSFSRDFKEAYTYNKKCVFTAFHRQGAFLYMIFKAGEGTSTKTIVFKWSIGNDDTLKYIDNRSENEVKRFESSLNWEVPSKDDYRDGDHPHISINDKVFVETIGGDLTIKVEDNTATGLGIYAEDVEEKGQLLDDAQVAFDDREDVVFLKIRPYRETVDRLLIYDHKLKEVVRLNSSEQSLAFLPQGLGIISPEGYYLLGMGWKGMNVAEGNFRYLSSVHAPNGEDILYVFFDDAHGEYLLIPFNLIGKEAYSPIVCNGYGIEPSGKLVLFKAGVEPKKVHALQIWNTPYGEDNVTSDSAEKGLLANLGNQEVVQAIAGCQDIILLTYKEEAYETLYADLAAKATDLLDKHYWLDEAEACDLAAPLGAITENAKLAITEFEAVSEAKKNAKDMLEDLVGEVEDSIKQSERAVYKGVQEFIEALEKMRGWMGRIVSAKEVAYIDLEHLGQLESAVQTRSERLGQACVAFLLRDEALMPFVKQQQAIAQQAEQLNDLEGAVSLLEEANGLAGQLELLVETVHGLTLPSADSATELIQQVSGIFNQLNVSITSIRKRKDSLAKQSQTAEFGAKFQLLEQSAANYLALADDVEKCESYLAKAMLQLEEMEAAFGQIEEFALKLKDKREQLNDVFESKKEGLLQEALQKAAHIEQSAKRMLETLVKRASKLKSEKDIRGLFAADRVVIKIREMAQQLSDLDNDVKAGELESAMKAAQEQVLRKQQDQQDLYTEGDGEIRLGNYRFAVNKQALEASMVLRQGEMCFHINGTSFSQPIDGLRLFEDIYDQTLVSEPKGIYRAEYLAYKVFAELKADVIAGEKPASLETKIEEYMLAHFDEGYVKGVHDADALLILKGLLEKSQSLGALRYSPLVRACGIFFLESLPTPAREDINKCLNAYRGMDEGFLKLGSDSLLVKTIRHKLSGFFSTVSAFSQVSREEVAAYLAEEFWRGTTCQYSPESIGIIKGFKEFLTLKRKESAFEDGLKALESNPDHAYSFVKDWLEVYRHAAGELHPSLTYFLPEAIALVALRVEAGVKQVGAQSTGYIKGMKGEHALVKEGRYWFDYFQLEAKMEDYLANGEKQYEAFNIQKKEELAAFRRRFDIEALKPKVFNAFVRNSLIDKVYLPLIGENLAKQIGDAENRSSTGRSGMLLLISPPGYGKTTLMEYTAERLGFAFVKVNGPSLGHETVTLDPASAPSATARVELEKLNLALEMGDNVMLYIDDIQHCNPEFLQKFISLGDGQRKIEGVFEGEAKTYDMRSKRFFLAMAGNPYTESGELFRIPDMLANRADIYNLGDMSSMNKEAFEDSFIENAIAANPTLRNLRSKPRSVVNALLSWLKTAQKPQEGWANISPNEQQSCYETLSNLSYLREKVLKVNQKYIHSSGVKDEFRTEPAFKLQGSYRNMNKLAERVSPRMNEDELNHLLMAHYEQESQTLAQEAEASLLCAKETLGMMNAEETARWEELKISFTERMRQNLAVPHALEKLVAEIGKISSLMVQQKTL